MVVSDILAAVSAEIPVPKSQAAAHQAFIKEFEGAYSLEDFQKVLVNHPEKDDWVLGGIKNFEAGSPSSAHIIFQQLQTGKHLSLEDVFRSEINLACQCCLHPDFSEGVRALLVYKDLSPKWQPATLDRVTNVWVESYFASLWPPGEHPLKDLGNG